MIDERTGASAIGPVPGTVGAISSAWLERVLAGAGVVPTGGAVRFSCREIGQERGMTGQTARALWCAPVDGPDASVVVKIPNAVANYERCAREVHFYRHLADRCGVRVPRAFAAEADPDRQRVVLVLEDLAGRPGDVVDGCSLEDAEEIVVSMARMHGRWSKEAAVLELRALTWLPWWGQGEEGADAPHRRRAERYRHRLGAFLRHFGEHVPQTLLEIMEDLVPRYEHVLASVASLPVTLIHADLHLDNVIFEPGEAAIIDWQSVSLGPGSYDLARFLSEGVREARDALNELIDLYLRTRADVEERPSAPTEFRREFRDVLCCVLAGYVSGYGGRDPATLLEREHAMIERALSPQGLGGLAQRVLGS